MIMIGNLDFARKFRLCQQVIIDKWSDRVCSDIPAAKGQQYLALLDSLPELLENLAQLFEKNQSGENGALGVEIGKYHGLQRFSLKSYSVNQVLSEYQILRQVIFDVMSCDIEGNLELIRRIMIYIDHCVASAVDTFNFEERQEEQVKAAKLKQERDESHANLKIREQFVAAISHDLRNPIATAKLALSLLRHELPETDEIEELAMILARSLERAETIVKDLLDINLVRSGRRILLNICEVDLVKVSAEIVKDLASAYQGRLVMKAEDQLVGYWCPNNIKRVLENLLTNALKYGDKNLPVTLTLKESHSDVIILVHNFGEAIAPSKQDALFEPFVRANSVPGNTDIGWGLGLAVVRAVSEAHGGQVDVISKENEGTTFVVKLPKDSRPYQPEVEPDSAL